MVAVRCAGVQSTSIRDAKLEAGVSGKKDKSVSCQRTTNIEDKAWTEELKTVVEGDTGVLFDSGSTNTSIGLLATSDGDDVTVAKIGPLRRMCIELSDEARNKLGRK